MTMILYLHMFTLRWHRQGLKHWSIKQYCQALDRLSDLVEQCISGNVRVTAHAALPQQGLTKACLLHLQGSCVWRPGPMLLRLRAMCTTCTALTKCSGRVSRSSLRFRCVLCYVVHIGLHSTAARTGARPDIRDPAAGP